MKKFNIPLSRHEKKIVDEVNKCGLYWKDEWINPLKRGDKTMNYTFKTQKNYPLAEEYRLNKKMRNMKAVYTGEKRPPRKGEWYLSGAVVEAYLAPNDLTTSYHIAKLVKKGA